MITQNSTFFWITGIIALVFYAFLISTIFWLPSDGSVKFAKIFTGALVIGLPGFFFVKHAVKIDKQNKNAIEYGVVVSAQVKEHSRSFNPFSSTRYYVIVYEFNFEGKTIIKKYKTTKIKLMEKFPIGKTFNIKYHQPSNASVILLN